MEYLEIVNEIQNKRRFGKASGREVTEKLMAALGHPEHGMSVIHIAGTNGKGSTAAFTSEILKAAGFSVGRFTSPHLITFRERIAFNGEMISEEDVVRLGTIVLETSLELEPTMFDLCLAIAILYFKEKQVDYVVLETGLGGAKDSTTGLDVVPKVSAITNIGLDHTAILGNTIEEIAVEKAGIIKTGTTLLLGVMDERAEKVIRKIAEEKKVSTKGVNDLLDMISTMEIGLNGGFQRDNAALAVGIVEAIFNQDCGYLADNFEKFVRCGLMFTSWPGRMEIVSDNPLTYVDGAHNPQGVEALFNALKELYPNQKFVFVMGVMADKDYTDMILTMLSIADCFVTVTVDDQRALPAASLADKIASLGGVAESATSVAEAMERGGELAISRDEILVAFGSLYFVGEVKGLLRPTQQ